MDGVLHPRRFPLQVVKRVPAPFNSADWLFEVKHDGFRVLAIREGSPPRLYTRNGYDISLRHQHITAALALSPRASSPFRDTISDPDARFCEPALRAAVEFLDFTEYGYLRSPAFRRFADEVFSKI
jgi:hypothetical protein